MPRRLVPFALAVLGGCTALTRLSLPQGPCGFDVDTLSFAGDALTQARCLLRPVAPGGAPAREPAALPASLEALVGQPFGDLRASLRRWLDARHVPDAAIGGSLDAPLAHARDDDPAAPAARYFVLHDTSYPYLGDARKFPPDDDASLNELRGYVRGEAVAHLFINRRGETVLGHDLRVPWRATQLENRRVGVAARGLFLHVELVQPRRRDPSGPARNDRLAPTPGFTDAQYAQLALVYTAASVRRGDWLVPAFHAAIDEGIAGAHDDPQNFEIEKFARAVERLREAIR